ncbi:MAG: GDP-mannose 4,6-dehydratase [Candidatus Diapherotrites archaeon]
MPRFLVTGANGFAASHLIGLLLARKDARVFGTVRKGAELSRIRHLAKNKNFRRVYCSLGDAKALQSAVHSSAPDFVFHLAAQSYVKGAPAECTLNANVLGSFNLLEAVRRHAPDARVQIAGSSEEYGLVNERSAPVLESATLKPATIYGVSKAAMEFFGSAFHATYGMEIITTRAFNHAGAGQNDNFVLSSWARQVAEIEAGKKGAAMPAGKGADAVLRVGNLEVRRDFLDVRDVVSAYVLCAEEGKAGEAYNVCSGTAPALRGLLDALLRLTDKRIKVETDTSLLRKSGVDIPLMLGDNGKLKALGWERRVTQEKMLADLLDYWRARV